MTQKERNKLKHKRRIDFVISLVFILSLLVFVVGQAFTFMRIYFGDASSSEDILFPFLLSWYGASKVLFSLMYVYVRGKD